MSITHLTQKRIGRGFQLLYCIAINTVLLRIGIQCVNQRSKFRKLSHLTVNNSLVVGLMFGFKVRIRKYINQTIVQLLVDRFKFGISLKFFVYQKSILLAVIHKVACASHILIVSKADGQRSRLVSAAFHLVGIPVGIDISKVYHTHVGTVAFHLLNIPERECIVVAVGKEYCVRLARIKIVFGKITCSISVRTVVVVPVLTCQKHRRNKADSRNRTCN